MVESLLKLIKADSIIEIDIEVPVGFSDSFESVIDFDPEQVQHPLERTALSLQILIAPNDRSVCSVHVGTHDEKHLLRLVLVLQLLHRQVEIQVHDVCKLLEVYHIALLDLFENQFLCVFESVKHKVRHLLIPFSQRHQVVLFQILRVKKCIFELREVPEVDLVGMQLVEYLVLLLIEHIFIVDLVEVLQIAFVLVRNAIVHERALFQDVLHHRRRLVFDPVLIVEVFQDSTLEQTSSFILWHNWVHVCFVGLIAQIYEQSLPSLIMRIAILLLHAFEQMVWRIRRHFSKVVDQRMVLLRHYKRPLEWTFRLWEFYRLFI